MKSAQVIRAGEDCWIEARDITDVRTGNLIDVTDYPVHATARAAYQRYVLGRPQYAQAMRYRMLTPVIAEWSTTPTGTQGTITAGGSDPYLVSIHITPTQSLGWRAPLVIIQAELTDPITGYKSRIVDEIYELSYDAVTSA
jgi:hypothetical protein